MNIYLQEIKMAYKSMLAWTIGLVFIGAFFMMLFPAMSKDAEALNTIVSKLPEAFVKAMGLSTLDMATINGFYGFMFMYVTLIGGLYAMKSGLTVLSEEVRSKTSDFLLVKPVKRSTIVSAKIASVLTLVIIQNLIYVPIAFAISYQLGSATFEANTFLLISLSLLLIQLFFIGLGLVLSVSIKKIKSVLPLTMGIVFGFFIIQLLNQSLDEKALTFLTPFAYFDVVTIIDTKQFNSNYLILDFILVALMICATYIIYQRKNVPAV